MTSNQDPQKKIDENTEGDDVSVYIPVKHNSGVLDLNKALKESEENKSENNETLNDDKKEEKESSRKREKHKHPTENPSAIKISVINKGGIALIIAKHHKLKYSNSLQWLDDGRRCIRAMFGPL
ncbi:hypothetical protein TcasGA2_TC003962 [Tribolium castaneum]|uniref:Uncharacterized protein n=1 Tax=Tribolium castaneum TaxID=7070 RepID=D6WI22_TRICA|nr:hypothetical protein TcasGA2_TC003962 [Tribolium castaneum]